MFGNVIVVRVCKFIKVNTVSLGSSVYLFTLISPIFPMRILIDDIAFQKNKCILVGRGSKERQSVCCIYDIIIFPRNFLFILSPCKKLKCNIVYRKTTDDRSSWFSTQQIWSASAPFFPKFALKISNLFLYILYIYILQ